MSTPKVSSKTGKASSVKLNLPTSRHTIKSMENTSLKLIGSVIEFAETDAEASARFKSQLKLLSMASGINVQGVSSCESARLLFRNTESFKCLAQILLSSSSLARQRLFLFPPLEDPGIDEVFGYIEPDPIYDATGIEKYKNTCKELNIVPLSGIIKSLSEKTMNLTYYGLTVFQIRALSETLKINTIVENLILQENWLPIESVNMICDMLGENTTIQVINFQECRVGDEGAEKLNAVLASSQSLKEINLSFNDITDAGLISMQQGFCESASLKKVNIGHNRLTEDSADALQKIFMENKNIEEWDFSWNGFFTGPGNKKIFMGLQKSDRIKVLNLAWNGIGTRAATIPITKYIRKSTALEHVDLCNNRLDHRTIRSIRTCLIKNKSLISAKLGCNLFQPEEAEILITMMKSNTADPLHDLDLENTFIKKETKPILNQVIASGKTIKIGGILSDYTIVGPDSKKLIFERCRYLLQKPKKKKAKKDLGHLILALPEKPIMMDDFTKEIKKKKMKKLDKDLVAGLAAQFVYKKNRIDCAEMKRVYMSYYPDASLPPPKPKKKKKKKASKRKKSIRETEVAVIDLDEIPEKLLDAEEAFVEDKNAEVERKKYTQKANAAFRRYFDF